jgi:ATP-dependent helicase/nuclease subunit B
MSHAKDSGTTMAAAVFFEQIASSILQQHNHALPDLRQLIIVLPNYHVAVPLAQHLARAAKLPALLLPQMVTLNDWAESIPLTQIITPDTCRASTLYQALRAQNWFPGADLWGIVAELLALLDELTRHHVPLPQSEEAFLEHLERAYRSRRNAAMQFEARVVHELWYAMSSSGEQNAARAYQQRLAILAQQANAPLAVLLTSDLSALEMHFLESYATQATVNVVDIRVLCAQQENCVVLHAALGQSAREKINLRRDANALDNHAPVLQLREQAEHLSKNFPQASLASRLRLPMDWNRKYVPPKCKCGAGC